MQEYGKKAGITLGHIICVFVLLFCFTDAQESFSEEGNAEKLMGHPTSEASSNSSVSTEQPEPTKFLKATEIPGPTETLKATEVPGPTETPKATEIPGSTETPKVTEAPEPTEAPEVTKVPEQEAISGREEVKARVKNNILENVYAELENTGDSWWFLRKKNHEPSGSGEAFDICEYQGFYLDKEVSDEDKVIYLTIDCGYASANTNAMLDIFKKHDIKVTFFVTNYFLKESPDEVRRMVADGHTVGNHSVSHKDLRTLSNEEIYNEIVDCEEKFYEITGTQMALFFRPPTGAYSRRTLQITEDLGYSSVFWSIAYRDYDKNDQPGKDYVLDHFATYHHNGAIALMHNDSDSNREAMDELLTYLKEEGYRFATLDEMK